MPVRALESESSAYPSFATDAYATTMDLSNKLQHNHFQNSVGDQRGLASRIANNGASAMGRCKPHYFD